MAPTPPSPATPPLPAAQARQWARYQRLCETLDSAFRVPGTSWRFGIDALLGVVPAAGDVLGALFAAYGLLVARRLGAPAQHKRKPEDRPRPAVRVINAEAS